MEHLMNEFVWTCPLCNSRTEHHHYFARAIGRLWVGEGYAPVPIIYAICDTCGLVFQWYRMDDKEQYQYYSKLYRATIQGGNDGVTERVVIEQTRRAESLLPEIDLEEVKSVLDIGASTGILMLALKDKYNCEVIGIEPGEKFRMHARKKKLKMLSDLDILHEVHKKAFDLITCIHTLEHFADPVSVLLRLHDYANKYLLIEVPNMAHEFSLNLSHPIAFTEETLREMLSRTGWEVVWLKKYNGFKVDRQEPCNLLVLAKQGQLLENNLSVDIEAIKAEYEEGQRKLYELQRQAAVPAK